MKFELQETVSESPMSRFQVAAVVLCIALNMLDGFDVLAMAFTAPHVAAAWHLTGKQVGLLLSAGLFGMGAGSLLIAPLADYVGRRPIILVSLLTISGGMLLSAIAQNVFQLAATRIISGSGIGSLLASLMVITSEYASNRWRSAAVSMEATGYALGATIGGAISGVLLAHFDWRSVFVFGGLATAAMIPLALVYLPESLDFILARRPRNALPRINAILARMDRAQVDELPPPPNNLELSERTVGLRSLFSGKLALRTCMIWLAFFLVMASLYFVLSWTPKLFVQMGMSAAQGLTVGVLLNVGGIVGSTAFSLLAARIRLRTLLVMYLATSAALLMLFGAVASSLDIAMPVAVAIGAGISGCIGGIYALTPMLYPARARTTGMGLAIGMGRIGAVVAPFSAGLLVDADWHVPSLYFLFAVPLLAALATVMAISKDLSRAGFGRTPVTAT